MSSVRLLHPGSQANTCRVSKLAKTSVVDVSRRLIHQHSSEVDSMSEAIPRRVLTAELTVDKHREMILVNVICLSGFYASTVVGGWLDS